MLEKESILEIKNIYTANAFQVKGECFVGAGSETEPDVKLYHLQHRQTEQITGCPGGMMSFLPVPGRNNQYISIMGLFPPFIGGEAGLYLHTVSSGRWRTEKVMDLPFAHRCEFIQEGNNVFLVAATVSRFKEDPSDWSRPGELHIIDIGKQDQLPWKSSVTDQKLFRNHGMTKIILDGAQAICVSGAEGIFAVQRKQKNWQIDPVFHREVSEMCFIDLDGDGVDELVTIEPFHGDSICIYKREAKQWNLLFSDSLSFGHGLSAGYFQGIPVVVAGNRSGSFALEMFTANNLAKGIVEKSVIETEAGPTQTQVFTYGSVDYILSANQRKNEVAIYSHVPE